MQYFVSFLVVHSSWRKRERESWLLYFNCLPDAFLTGSILCHVLTVPCVVMQRVLVVFPGHVHFSNLFLHETWLKNCSPILDNTYIRRKKCGA